MSDRNYLRFTSIHGCVTLLWWLGLLALVIYWGGRVYRLW